jgi:glycosidase
MDYQTQTFQKRGTFADVEKELPKYGEAGVSVLYLMGVFERDNCPVKGTAKDYYINSTTMMRKENASALAVTSRETPCEMLGGKQGFESLIAKAKKEKIKIIVDCLARISSSRHHRKFRDLLLHYLDEDGRRHICYGTDG